MKEIMKTDGMDVVADKICTAIIQEKIDDCHRRGGGEVRLAPGRYLCGTLYLKSGVRLYLEKGAVIQGSRDEQHYPEMVAIEGETAPGDLRCLIHADGVEDAALTGEGMVDGGFPEPLSQEDACDAGFRPRLCFFRDCRRLEIAGLKLQNSGFWTVHLLRCEQVTIEGLLIRNPYDRINTDGIDPDSCQDVTVRNCVIETGDDCIVLKATCNKPCEDIVVSGCELRTCHGAIKIGTEAIAPIRRVTVKDCRIPEMGIPKGPALGIAVYMKDGSHYEDFTFERIRIEGHNELAVMVDDRPRWPREGGRPGVIRNLCFRDLDIRGGGRLLFEGRSDSPLCGLILERIRCRVTESGLSTYKPRGSSRNELDTNLPEFLQAPHHVIIANAAGVIIDMLQINNNRNDATPDRGLLALFNVWDSKLSAIHGSINRDGFPEILIDSVREKCEQKEG